LGQLTRSRAAAIETTHVSAGQFVISLDFELHWGVRDHSSVEAYRENLLGVRTVIPALLARFRQREIHATWATVGILFARTRDEALAHAPANRPLYSDSKLDAYAELERAGSNEAEDPFHFGASLVDQIAATPNQELATHTFSHFYCLESGPTIESFEADLASAKAIGARLGEVTRSIVFPRNQYDHAHLEALRRAGTVAFRGNPEAWFWQPAAASGETVPRRALRLVDSYLRTGRAPTAKVTRHSSGIVDVPATRFLRPWTPSLARLEPLKLLRIRNEMTRAASTGSLFHLWWHPHNFGRYPVQNLAALDRVLDVFDELRRSHGMKTETMAEAALAA
jgi:peptidoglycan/xylan/chitin deacetylase (PgdA/CDA1 family)